MRKPHELYEQQQSALSSARSAPGGALLHSNEASFSLLGVAALRQALKVARSAKMPAHARAAVCGYVAGKRLPPFLLASACLPEAVAAASERPASKRSTGVAR